MRGIILTVLRTEFQDGRTREVPWEYTMADRRYVLEEIQDRFAIMDLYDRQLAAVSWWLPPR